MIVLPFPAKILWPNGRGHHMKKHREFQKHKEWARRATLSALPRSFKWNGEPIRLRYTITPKAKTTRAIDADNAIAAMKAYQDGIAAAPGFYGNKARTQQQKRTSALMALTYRADLETINIESFCRSYGLREDVARRMIGDERRRRAGTNHHEGEK